MVGRGPQWGNAQLFTVVESDFQDLLTATPSIPGLASAGPRPCESVERQLRLEQAAARAGIYAELNLELLEQIASFRIIETQAATKEDYLGSPSLGGWLGSETRNQLTPENTQVQILVSDGLNAEAA